MILKPMGTPGKAPKHVRAWTQQEDALLAELYPSHTAPELTKHFQRTESAIRSRIRLLLSQGVIHAKQTPLSTKELSMLIIATQKPSVNSRVSWGARHPR